MNEGEKLKREVPQINSQTGVTADYSNEITPIRNSFLKGNTEQIIERTRSVKKYQERYPLDSYNHVITEKNKDAIDCLNQLVDKLNQLVQDEVFNKDEFVSVYNEMRKLIYGSESSGQIDVKDFGKSKE